MIRAFHPPNPSLCLLDLIAESTLWSCGVHVFFWGIKVSWCILDIWICQISSHFFIPQTSIVYCSAYFLEGISSFFSRLFLLCVAFYLLLHDEKFGSDSQKNKADKWGEEKLYNIKRVRLCLWIAIQLSSGRGLRWPIRCGVLVLVF